MRKLPLLLALLLLALLGTAVAAQAAALPQPGPLSTLLVGDDEEDAGAEASDAEEEEGGEAEEVCELDQESLCEEEDEEEEKGRSQDDACLLRDATAAVSLNPGKRRLRLVVRYRTSKSASVSVEAVLRGMKGTVYLGTTHTRFRRSGVYRDTYELAERETKRALAAREVSVDLQALDTPPSCRFHLTEALRRARH